MTTLSIDEAEDILYDHLACQEVSQHRWYTKELIVFRRGDQTMGFYHLRPASELQEDQDRFEADPVPVFEVVGREITHVVYEVAR